MSIGYSKDGTVHFHWHAPLQAKAASRLSIHDVSGRLVGDLTDKLKMGMQTCTWDGKGLSGRLSGVLFIHYCDSMGRRSVYRVAAY
jgi:hypothetical protein